MNFRRANFPLPLLASALLTAVPPVAAQNNPPSSSQPVIFSVPVGGNSSTNGPLLLSRPFDRQPNFPDDLRAPVDIFNVPAPSLPSPARPPAQPLTRAEAQRLQRMLDVRDNWALMTPEEILGVSASVRAAEGEADDNQKDLNVFERFLERQRPPQITATNRFRSRNDDPSSSWDLSQSSSGVTNRNPFNLARLGLPTSAQILDRFFDDASDDSRFSGQDGSGAWFKSLGSPPQPAPATSQQQAERERFQQLLEPGLSSDPSPKSSPASKFLYTLQPLPDSTPSSTPAVNPVGASFAPLSSGISRPAGLPSLPGITNPTNWQSSTPPAWAPQPPPWLVQTPQPFAMPQRKF